MEHLDASIARSTVLSDEITALMPEAMNRRTYTM
ncbi:zinc transport protein ZntB [Pectobacterium versatile]|nr:zinc transport protein ZntB [Pectobacterium versatile]